jgi:hypothetical protein
MVLVMNDLVKLTEIAGLGAYLVRVSDRYLYVHVQIAELECLLLPTTNKRLKSCCHTTSPD